MNSDAEISITFSDKIGWKDRYMITPYRYTPKKAMKLTSEKFWIKFKKVKPSDFASGGKYHMWYQIVDNMDKHNYDRIL